LLEEVADVMDNIWPDEHYLRIDFENEFAFDSSQKNPHTETKMRVAEMILGLLQVACFENLANKEYVFFELTPIIQQYVIVIIEVKDNIGYSLGWVSGKTKTSSCSRTWSLTATSTLTTKKNQSTTSFFILSKNYA